MTGCITIHQLPASNPFSSAMLRSILMRARLAASSSAGAELRYSRLDHADLTGATITGSLHGGGGASRHLFRPKCHIGSEDGTYLADLIGTDLTDAQIVVRQWWLSNQQGIVGRGTFCPGGSNSLSNPGSTCCGHYYQGKAAKSCIV